MGNEKNINVSSQMYLQRYFLLMEALHVAHLHTHLKLVLCAKAVCTTRTNIISSVN